MNRTLTLILLVSCIVPAVAPVVAQEETNATTTPTPMATASEDNTTPTAMPTATPTPTATDTPAPAANPPEDNTTTVVAIGPNTRVTSWTYRGGAFHMVIEADVPMRMTLTEAVRQDGSGAGTISYDHRNLASGENEIRIPVATTNGQATLILSTPASVSQDTAAFLHHDGNGASLLGGPYDLGDVRDGGIGAALGTSFTVLYAAARAKLGAAEGGERVA